MSGYPVSLYNGLDDPGYVKVWMTLVIWWTEWPSLYMLDWMTLSLWRAGWPCYTFHCSGMDKRVESSPRFPGKLQIIGKLRLESWIQFVTSFHEILIPLIELREARAGKVQRVHTNFGSSCNSRIVHIDNTQPVFQIRRKQACSSFNRFKQVLTTFDNFS